MAYPPPRDPFKSDEFASRGQDAFPGDPVRAASAEPDIHALALLIDSIPGLVFTTRPNGELEWINRTIRAYFGRSLEELKTWQMTDAVHPEDLSETIARWGEGAASGQAYELEQRLRRHDGVYRWFHFRAAPLHDDAGRLVRWYGLVTDIDDLKRAEEVLLTRERDLGLIVETMPALVWCASPDGKLTFVNSRILEFTGATFDELVDNWHRYVHPDEVDASVEAWARSTRTGSPLEVQYRFRDADGSYRWIQSIARLSRDEGGRPSRWYGLLIDIDERLKTEEALRNTRARLAKAAQLAAVSELAASIAHEINQPLSAVVANGHACHRWLSAATPNIERAVMSAERIIRDGNSAADIVSRVRSLFRHAAPTKQPLKLNDVIEEVCNLIGDELRSRGIALKLDLQRDMPEAAADRIQMQQVIVNLTRNSIDALEEVMGRAKALTISSRASDGELVVRVKDTGVGLQDVDAVFEAFFTTKASGMGMGLAISRSILEAHGGRLWASRNPDHGATFAFALRMGDVTDEPALSQGPSA